MAYCKRLFQSLNRASNDYDTDPLGRFAVEMLFQSLNRASNDYDGDARSIASGAASRK